MTRASGSGSGSGGRGGDSHFERADPSLRGRIAARPGPALWWLAGLGILVAVEFGALASTVVAMPWADLLSPLLGALPQPLAGPLGSALAVLATVGDALADLPTLLDRSLIANQGYRTPDGWTGTFLGLSPAAAWALRLGLVYAYAGVFCWWLWRGYGVFREHYRRAPWTPTDDAVDRFREHSWGRFGLAVVVAVLVLAVFAPTVGPTTLDQNVVHPYGHQIEHYDADTGTVETVSVGVANLASKSQGDRQNFGIGSYDPYDRFHPAGTLLSGKDLFTYVAYGARVSLFVGLVATLLAGTIALVVATLGAYYGGVVDLAAVFAGDSFQSMPRLLVLIMLAVALDDTWLADVYSGALLLAVLFGAWGWPPLWRAVRAPALQTVEASWIDAAESVGQRADVLIRKHVAPYVVGYLLVYASMSLGGYLVATAGLSYIGIGIQSPTPEWGRAIAAGQNYVVSASWHVSVIPGLAITTVVVGFNALGDGIRDAIDPKSGATVDEAAAAEGA